MAAIDLKLADFEAIANGDYDPGYSDHSNRGFTPEMTEGDGDNGFSDHSRKDRFVKPDDWKVGYIIGG